MIIIIKHMTICLSKNEQAELRSSRCFDTDMMIEDIMKLKKGRSVFRPVYSFVNHNRTDKTVKVEPAQVIIIDGILILETGLYAN